MSQGTAFPTKSYVHLAKSDQSLLDTLWVAKDPKRPKADCEDSDQTARMRRLV